MRAFFLSIIDYILIILALNFVIYFHWNGKVESYTADINKHFNYNTFLFADSHGNCLHKKANYFHINNLSSSSDSYEDIRRKLEYLLLKNTEIDTIVISVDPHMLSTYRENKNNDMYSATLSKPYMKYFPSLIGQYTTSIPGLIQIWFNSQNNLQANDSAHNYAMLTNEVRSTGIMIRFKDQFKRHKKSSHLRGELEQIISICKENDIKIFGLKFPLVREYAYMAEGSNFGADKIFYEQDIPVIDCQNLIFDYSMYKDQDHLTEEGGYILLGVISKNVFRKMDKNYTK